jgi:hypothetical protein
MLRRGPDLVVLLSRYTTSLLLDWFSRNGRLNLPEGEYPDLAPRQRHASYPHGCSCT